MELEDEIRRRNLPPGTPICSVSELRKMRNCSHVTANDALNLLEKKGIICRIPRKGSFVAKFRTKTAKRKFTIAYNLYDSSGVFVLEKLITKPEKSSLDLLKAEGFELMPIQTSVFYQKDLIHKILAKADALFMSQLPFYWAKCGHLYDIGIPVVLFHGDFQVNLPFHQVYSDPMPALREMFVKAMPWHFRGITIIRHTYENAIARANACEAAAREAGFDDVEQIVLEPNSNCYVEAMKILPYTQNRLIFSCTSKIGIPFLRAFNDQNLRPSIDYHLVNFDDVERINIHPFQKPQMTAIGYSHEKILSFAIKILLQELRNPSGVIHKVLVPTKLTIRKSALAQDPL